MNEKIYKDILFLWFFPLLVNFLVKNDYPLAHDKVDYYFFNGRKCMFVKKMGLLILACIAIIAYTNMTPSSQPSGVVVVSDFGAILTRPKVFGLN